MLQNETQHIVVFFDGFRRVLLADFIDVLLYFSGLNGLNFAFAEIGNQMPLDRCKAGIRVCVGLDVGFLIEFQATNCPLFKSDRFCLLRLS